MKVKGLDKFRLKLKAFGKKVEEAPEDLTKKLMIDIQTRTILKSPVDTGRLIGGWQISISKSAPSFKHNKYANTSKSGKKISRKSKESSIKQKTISENEDKIEKFKGSENTILWLANNVDYAKYREYGTNKSAGKFMLTKAIQQVKLRAGYHIIRSRRE